MRTKLIISLGMLTALAVGCSKELPTVNENAWIYDESLPVPIQFGSLSTGMVTKAAVSNLDGLTGKPIGVFAWGEGSDDSMETSAESIFPAGFMRAQVEDISGAVGSLKFWEKDAQASTKVYYPMSSKYNYSFYAYYTGEEPALGTYGENDYSIDVDFSQPFTDILWGKCSDSDLPYGDALPHLTYKENQIKGFNSRFSRAAAKAGEPEGADREKYLPKIEFQHLCSAFSFFAKGDDDPSMTPEKLTELNEHVKINSVEITNVPISATLVVAAREGNQGVFEPIESTSSVSMVIKEDYEIKKGDDNVILSNNDGENQFFLPPGDYENSKAILHCTLDNNPFDLPFDLKYDVQNADVTTESTVFEAGKRYSFVVLFKTLEKIEIMLSLKDWVEPVETEIDIDNNE